MLTLNTTATAAIATATGTASQEFAGIVKEKLCQQVCINQTLQPTYAVTYSVVSSQTNGTTTFVELQATGTITYVPKNGCSCNTITQSFAETTTLIFSNSAATSAPTVTLVQGKSAGTLADVKCTTANSYQIATDVVVSAVYA